MNYELCFKCIFINFFHLKKYDLIHHIMHREINYSNNMYVYINKHGFEYKFNDFLSCFHEMISTAIDNKNIVINYGKIEIRKLYEFKNHNYVSDVLTLTNNYDVYSEYKNKSYNINDDSDLCDFLILYGEFDITVSTLRIFKKIIKDLTNGKNNSKTFVKKDDKRTNQKNVKNVYVPYDIDLLTKKVNTKPTIEKIVFPEEFKIVGSDGSDESNSEISDNESNDETDKISVDSAYLKKLNDEIKKLEESKLQIDSTVKSAKNDLTNEEENLSKFACVVSQKKYELKKEEERENEERNIFTSEKEYTYPKIFNHFFVKKIIKSWNDLPPLFMIKFPIYLFLDGKDTEGKDTGTKILGTDDEFRLYKMLYRSLIDDEFEMPDNDDDANLVREFMENLPPIPIMTSNDIMETLNESDDELFGEDTTSVCSGDDPTDVGGNTTY